MKRFGQEAGDRLASIKDLLPYVPPGPELGQHVGAAGLLLRLGPLGLTALLEVNFQPGGGYPVNRVRFELTDMLDHHIHVPKRPEPTPNLLEHLVECDEMFRGEHAREQPQCGFQPAGGHASIVNAGDIKFPHRLGNIVMEFAHELVEVGKEAKMIVFAR